MKTMHRGLAVGCGLLLLSFEPRATAQPSLEDFGHGSLRTHGEKALGQRRCLLILMDDLSPNVPNFMFHNAAYFENLMFNPLAPRDVAAVNPRQPGSVNGYLAENSHGRFTLTRAIGAAHPTGSIGPLLLTAEEFNLINSTNATDQTPGQMALAAATRAGFNLGDFDTDANGVVDERELILVVVRAAGGDNGMARGLDFKPPGSTTTFRGQYCAVLQQVSFATLAHEVSHLFHTADLYYGVSENGQRRYYQGQEISLNNRTTLMGPTITAADDIFSYHLDPWHKLVLGWCEPRIVSLRGGGVFTIPAAHTQATDAPLILYDPFRGTNEFFMLEYRTRSRPAGGTTDSYDSNVTTDGLFLWHVQQNPDHTLPKVDSPFDLTSDPAGQIAADLPFANWVEGPPNAMSNGAPSPNTPWMGGQTTFFLRWNDAPTWAGRTVSPAWVFVHPFSPTDDQITVEIATTAATWVDFAYPGQPALIETGDLAFPFNTLAEGVAAVGYRGILNFKPGAGNPTPFVISKPMTLAAPLGPVRIGLP